MPRVVDGEVGYSDTLWCSRRRRREHGQVITDGDITKLAREATAHGTAVTVGELKNLRDAEELRVALGSVRVRDSASGLLEPRGCVGGRSPSLSMTKVNGTGPEHARFSVRRFR